jgi:2'-5' RNA ligase
MSHNLFFALWPDDDVREQIASASQHLKRTHAPRGRWIRPHRYHLTLRFLGEHSTLPDPLIAACRAVGDGVRAPPFSFALDMAGSFANRRIPWWLGCHAMPDALDALWSALAESLRANGIVADEPAPRVAHVTILRDADEPLPPERIEPIDWTVGDFVLVDSALGAEPGYAILQRWPLGA